MHTIDFSPLFRHSVGFDRMERLMDNARRNDSRASYPPYNIEQINDDEYRVVIAVSGFAEENLDITVKENTLLVSGKLPVNEEKTVYIHHGIAGRAFERQFELAEHIEVNGANLENGLLIIELVRRVPEEAKPKKITLGKSLPAPEGTKKKAA